MAKAKPVVSVIERRLAAPSVFRTSSQPIPMKDPKWTVRWENAAIAPDHIYKVLHDLGWEYATPDDLDCTVDEIGAQARDQRVVRGAKGDEVLLKMRTADFRSVQKKKDRENRDQTFGTKAIKQAVVEGVGAAHGEQAAEFMAQHVNAIHVSDSRGAEDI